MKILSARKYHTPRNGPLTADQAETRRLAYSIKHPGADWTDYDTAGREMAALILASSPQPSTLNPQPSTSLLPSPPPAQPRGFSGILSQPGPGNTILVCPDCWISSPR